MARGRRQQGQLSTLERRRCDVASVHVARNREEVESLRSVWTELQGPTLTSDIDFFLTLIRHAPAVIHPHVLVFERAGQPSGLVVGRVEDARLHARLAHGVGFAPHLRMLTVAYGGVLGDCGPEPALLAKLRRSLAGERVDLLRLRMVSVGSLLHTAAAAGTPALQQRRFSPAAVHWRCAIPGSFEQFMAARSKERRRHVRRYQRRLEAAHGQEVTVRRFRSRHELDELLADTGRVYRTTYQHALGVGFSDDELRRRLTELTMDRGWFLGEVLYVRGQPVAFWHGNAYRGTFGTTATGFDPDWAESRPGTYLLMRLVEDLCADPDVHTLDFGFGDASFKRSFGDWGTFEQDVVLFEPRPRPLAINVAQTGVLATAAAGRAALDRSGHLRAARTAWRRRLSRRAGS